MRQMKNLERFRDSKKSENALSESRGICACAAVRGLDFDRELAKALLELGELPLCQRIVGSGPAATALLFIITQPPD